MVLNCPNCKSDKKEKDGIIKERQKDTNARVGISDIVLQIEGKKRIVLRDQD